MQEYIIEVILYTFATYGVIIFFSEFFYDIKSRKSNNKIIIIYDKDEDFEDTYRRIINISKKFGVINNVYILNKNNKNIGTINKFVRNDNIPIINDKEELLKFVYK